MKCNFKKAVVQKTVFYIEMGQKLKLRIVRMMHMLTAAWNAVKPERSKLFQESYV
jgi:hypothetical protein